MGRQQQLVIMIKSPEKQYNAYRILKVLANQDYLAVDFSHAYYILSPVKTRHNIRTKACPIQNHFDDIPKILKPKQCIQIDRIHYYVFFIGQHEVICANNFETAKIKSQEELLAFFKGGVEQILKHLLMKDAKQARKVIDIKNSIIVKRRLYLLQLDRGRMFPRSLEKSEKLLIRGSQDSFRKILQNQLKIIKYFGLLMWEILYKTAYPTKKLKVQVNEEQTFLKRLLGEMVSKKITYEYICIRIREEESIATNWKGKRIRKTNSLMKKQVPRYKTQSMESSERYNHTISRMRTESHKENGPLVAYRKVRISHIKTGEDSIQKFQSRLPKFNQKKLKFSSIYRSTGQNSSFRDNRSKISVQAHQKLQKQTQVARNLFKRFVQAKFHLRRENDDEIGQNLRFKLVSKIERFKTELKSHSRQKDEHYYMSQKNVFSNLQSYESLEPITKKLDFNQQEGTSLMTTAINLAPTQREDRQESSRVQTTYEHRAQTMYEHRAQPIDVRKQQTIYGPNAQPMDEPKIQITENPKKTIPQQAIMQQTKPSKPQAIVNTVNAHKQDKGQMEEQIEFEVINLTNISQNLQTSTQAPQSVQKASLPEQHEAKEKVQTAQRKQKMEQMQKRNSLISQPKQSTDQIEVITIKKTAIEKPAKQQSKPSLKQQAPKPKPQKVVIDKLIKQIEQYESLISILGDISTRAIRIKNQLSSVQWKRPVYFIYQRFIYERSRFEQALLLGARQVVRKNRTHKDEQWDEWQKSNHRKQLIAKIQQENRLLKGLFNNFASKIPSECKFQRKIDYYIRNRDKLGMAQMAKIRHLLAKYTAKYVIEIYNTLIDNQATGKELLSFMEDCLYACFIMSELEDKLPEARWMKVGEYRKYTCDLQAIDLNVQLLYDLYFEAKDEEDVQT